MKTFHTAILIILLLGNCKKISHPTVNSPNNFQLQ